ncbi:MAG: hypothetical protein ACXWUB_11200 [Burkholderiales bacterium]
MSKVPADNVHGEGNYKASREFNKAERDFVASGKAEAAAGKASPKSEAEARELEAAEREAHARSKGEEPALARPASGKPPQSDTQRKR